MTESSPTKSKLGTRLRELRLARNLSVRALASRSGFSPSFISNIELDTVSPSIASLEKIASELGVSLGELFSSLESHPRVVIRSAERVSYESAWSRSRVTVLTDSGPGRRLSAIEVTLQPGGSSSKRPAVVPEDLVALILEGSLTMASEHEALVLSTGDTAYIKRQAAVAWQNLGMHPATLLLVSLADRAAVIAEVFDQRTTIE